MSWSGTLGALLLVASMAAAFAQDGVPTLTTDDVRVNRDSRTRANEEAATTKAEADTVERRAPRGTAAGYVKVASPSGYQFERPRSWEPIDNLVSQNAPSFFKYDAIFQDPVTGAVLSAISVDRSQLQSPIDISDAASVNTLLSTMLNPAGSKDGVKIFRQLTGDGPNGSRWLRVKAQGTGQAVDGTVVDTVFWVQLVQTDTLLALVAVGYPVAQQELAAQAAYHAVRTLEVSDGS
jgi:hypothetical protein